MNRYSIVGLIMFGLCILIGFSCERILEMDHTIGIDTSFYLGIMAGAMLLSIIYLLYKAISDI